MHHRPLVLSKLRFPRQPMTLQERHLVTYWTSWGERCPKFISGCPELIQDVPYCLSIFHSSNTPSKYGFTEKVIDGMKVEVRLIVVNFRDPTYRARLEISDILIQSTTPEWRPATLALTRYKNQNEDSVINLQNV